ncbi:MAG: tetratricopeptide repeat protein [Chloroflexi bacterium]|nr:tetratricopeptide repeat protein [Chloroflexota bacterium]
MTYLAAVFCDLERQSEAWAQTPRKHMVGVIAEYRYLAESIASQYGTIHLNFTGDGHLFLFENADASVQFGLKLIDSWKNRGRTHSHIPLRVGCHFGECSRLEGEAWVGRAINLAKRVESAAEPDSVYLTESLIELLDLPVYEIQEVGRHPLKGDHLPERALFRLASFDEAALDSKPNEEMTAEAWFLKAASLIGSKDENTEAEAVCYREALLLRADHPEAHNNLAVLLRAGGDEASAAEHYRAALRLRPDYPEAHYNYAVLLVSRGSVAGAAEHYREALSLRPEYVDAHHGYANLLKLNGDLTAAAEHYQEALRLRPKDTEAHNNFAILLEASGNPARAAEQYRDALRIRPDYLEAHYNYAILLENQGDSTAAEEHYRTALHFWPDYPEARNNLAVLLHADGRLDEAEEHYETVLRLRPNDPEVHYNYALLLKAKGSGTAEEHFRIAHELAPDVLTFQSAIEPPA